MSASRVSQIIGILIMQDDAESDMKVVVRYGYSWQNVILNIFLKNHKYLERTKSTLMR
jgi:inorganic pyrophosphatase